MEFLYLITNGRNYLGIDNKQQLTTVSTREKAKRFTKEKAENVLQNLPKTMKNIGYFITPDEESNSIIEIALSEMENGIYDILTKVQEFESYVQDIGKRRDILTYELSKVDAEIEDILHAAEFYNLNACEGYKLYKMLKERRIKRRQLKDYIEVVGYVECSTGKDFANGLGSKSILGTTTRKYQPRVLNELFDK